MDQKEFCGIAAQLLRCPAAPYHEHAVRSIAEKICASRGLPFRRDDFGNLIVTLRTDAKARPIAFAAHLDHPGFDIVRKISERVWQGRFLGGVGDSYFREGTKLRLMPGNVAGQLGKALPHKTHKLFQIHVEQAESQGIKPQFAVWEMEDFSEADGIITARACDDLIGVAALLCALIELKRRRSRVHALGIISRAEEVGFHGALMAATGGSIPRRALVVSLETSREMPPVKMGQGAILRVGDRASIFDSEGTRYLAELAAQLHRRTGAVFQRALMSGGTCEGTAYQQAGYQTLALCVALGNYHNCGANDQIAPEFVSAADACGMVDLMVEAARGLGRFQTHVAKLPRRLQRLAQEAKSLRAREKRKAFAGDT